MQILDREPYPAILHHLKINGTMDIDCDFDKVLGESNYHFLTLDEKTIYKQATYKKANLVAILAEQDQLTSAQQAALLAILTKHDNTKETIEFTPLSIADTWLKRAANFCLLPPFCCGVPWVVYLKSTLSPSCLQAFLKATFSPGSSQCILIFQIFN